MADYTLHPDEAVILKDDRVRYGTRSRAGDSYELVLTNRKVVLVKNVMKMGGLLGTSKEVVTFPINHVKVFNDQAQVAVINRTELEVFFRNGPERFRFRDKKTAARWLEQINLLATGREAEVELNHTASNALPGAEYISGAVKDTLETVKGRFAAKPAGPDGRVKVSNSCGRCGAPIEGIAGRSATCAYCGDAQVLGVAIAPTEPATPGSPSPGPPPPPPVSPATWATDPHGRYELRYWDGAVWTEHVSSGGVQTTDPA